MNPPFESFSPHALRPPIPPGRGREGGREGATSGGNLTTIFKQLGVIFRTVGSRRRLPSARATTEKQVFLSLSLSLSLSVFISWFHNILRPQFFGHGKSRRRRRRRRRREGAMMVVVWVDLWVLFVASFGWSRSPHRPPDRFSHLLQPPNDFWFLRYAAHLAHGIRPPSSAFLPLHLLSGATQVHA